METVLITGASGGIGRDLAELFARDGARLVLAARSEIRLAATARDLCARFHVEVDTVVCDLSVPGSAASLAATIADKGLEVDVLVNNAGYGLVGPFAQADMATQMNMLQLNAFALTELTGTFLSGMIARGRGGVLNVSSLAALSPSPFLAVYAASKAYVLSLSEALWEEARGTGVHVSCLCPGTTESAFHERAGTNGVASGKMKRMTSSQVAKIGYEGFRANQRVVVPGYANRVTRRLLGIMPRPVLLRAMRRAFT